MSRKTARNKDKRPDVGRLVRAEEARTFRLQSGASPEGQKWVNRKTHRGYKKEQAKLHRAERISADTRTQEGPAQEQE